MPISRGSSRSLLRLLWHRPLVRYLLVGVANTMTGLGIMYGLMYFLGADIVSANVAGYTIGIVQSFYLNKVWTFKSRTRIVSSFVRFLLVLALAYLANLATVIGVHVHLGASPYVAQALGIIPYTGIGFLGSRLFAFRDHPA